MHNFIKAIGFVVAVGASANVVRSPSGASLSSDLLTGFGSHPRVLESTGGKAICVQGNVDVQASALGVQLNYPNPANQSFVTETVVEFLQDNSKIAEQIGGPIKTISGTYSISVRLCFPKANPHSNSVQILTHGIGFDKSYWDVAAGYSYVDAAASDGSITFLYDRLGIGLSDHPDPIQVVQTGLEVAIVHELTQLLRNGAFAKISFSKVTGIGHSFGSVISIGQTVFYPTDLDGVVLTGVSINTTGLVPFVSGLNIAIAAENEPSRFQGLPNGYFVGDSSISNQFAFLRFPNFPPQNLEIAEATKQTATFGELFTITSVIEPALNYTGAVYVVNGANDIPFCDGDCTYPSDKAAQVLLLYPFAASGSTSYLVPGTGHGINLHYTAESAYSKIISFLTAQGLA